MDRCNHSGPRGQCPHQSVDGSEFCKRHSSEKDRIRGYRVSDPVLNDRLGYHNDPDSLKTVQQEVVLIRSMIERKMDAARNDYDYDAVFREIIPAVNTVNKLVENLHKLSLATSSVLGKTAIQKLANDIVSILVEELDGIPGHDTIIDKIAERITTAVIEASNE